MPSADRSREDGTDPAQTVEEIATRADPGLVAIPGGRFFGFVIGGTHPAALAADWLVSAWDQNSGSSALAPATVAMERIAGRWMLELFGLPVSASVGFVTGGQLANFTCLASARQAVLARAGWDVAERGLRERAAAARRRRRRSSQLHRSRSALSRASDARS